MTPFTKFFKKGTCTFFSDVSYLISGLVSLPPPVCVYVFMIRSTDGKNVWVALNSILFVLHFMKTGLKNKTHIHSYFIMSKLNILNIILVQTGKCLLR